MKKGKFSLLRFSGLFLLAGLFLYSASVQEIHFLFVNHHTELSEHCHNHLHQQTNHADCNLCKIELSSFVQATYHFDFTPRVLPAIRQVYNTLDVVVNCRYSSVSPRGPPVLS